MTNPIIVEVDCTTGQSVERPMTDAEYTDYQAQAAAAAAQAAADATAAANLAALKQSAITKLTTGQPLTADEAACIVP